MTNRIVLRFAAGVSPGYIDSLLDANALVLDTAEMHRPGVYVANKTNAASGEILALANSIYSNAQVMYCHPDFVAEVVQHGVPNDEFFAYQWNFRNTGQTLGTPGADIDAAAAWDITAGDSDVVVAVIDDGIQYLSGYQHPDIDYSRVLPGYDFGGNHPKYIASPDNDPSPCNLYTHGMACAGLIIAAQNNSEGMSGVAPGVRIRCVKIAAGSPGFDECTWLPIAYFSRIAWAIEWAAGSDANIFSCSWGMPPNDDVATEILFAYWGGKAMFFSAGNESRNSAEGVSFPASLPYVMAVGATDQWDRVWNYSNKGDSIDVMAPSGGYGGGNLFSLDGVRNTGYVPALYQCAPQTENNYMCGFGGTSGACPQVAGIAALILSVRPDLQNGSSFQVQELYQLIKVSAEDQLGDTSDTPGWDRYYGWGRVNAKAALDSALAWAPTCDWKVGDADGSGHYSISDAVYLINYIFAGGPPPTPHPRGSGDSDCSSQVSISDAVYLINYIFAGGPPPAVNCDCREYY